MKKTNKKFKRDYKDPLRQYHPATSVILAGYRPSLSEHSIKAPLFRTSTFEFENAQSGELFFKRAYNLKGSDGEEPGLVYSRLNNPNLEIFEDKIVAAESGAQYARLFPSGMSAISTAIISLVPRGGKILYSDPVYGGSYLFLKEFCPNRFGIETYSVDTSNVKNVEKFLKENGPVDMIFLESQTNPSLKLSDIKKIKELALKHCGEETLVCVDNTFMGPVFLRPFDLGADIVIYSATKFIGGHSDVIAGIVLTKSKEHCDAVSGYRTIMGSTPAPDNAWLLMRSIETLWVRMERQAEKAMKVAKALKKNKKIKKVIYPGLLTKADGDQYKIFKKQCLGPGSMISFYLENDKKSAAFKFLNSLDVCHLAVSLGGTESLIQHPRTMTHSDMTKEDLEKAEITHSLIRLSVGLESAEDLILDLETALEKI